jgi:hypothetical protein
MPGQDAAEFAGFFVGDRDRVDRPEGGESDFTGRHSGTNATLTCELKPTGNSTGFITWPIRAVRL